jgi:hypothetical protein
MSARKKSKSKVSSDTVLEQILLIVSTRYSDDNNTYCTLAIAPFSIHKRL